MSIDKMQQSQNHPAVRAGLVVPAEVHAAREFGRLLRAERLSRGIQRSDVAVALGLHPVHHDYIVTQVEIGEHDLTVTQARMLDRKLGIPAPHLMAEVGLVNPRRLDPYDMPLTGRQITEPTVESAESEVFRCTATAVLAFAVLAFLILSTVTAIIGGGPWGMAAAIICGLGAWAALSVGFLSLWARASVRQWQRNAAGR